MRLTTITSLALNAQKAAMTLVTCCASSRVGTRIRAVVSLLARWSWGIFSQIAGVGRGKRTALRRMIASSTGSTYAAVLPEPVLARAAPINACLDATDGYHRPSISLPSRHRGMAFFWTGVGIENPSLTTACCSRESRPNDEKGSAS